MPDTDACTESSVSRISGPLSFMSECCPTYESGHNRSQAAVHRNMIVFVMSHSVAESPTHKPVRKQSQTRCPRCGAWSAADRCPQCGAHRMSAEIGVRPDEELQDLPFQEEPPLPPEYH